MEFHDKLKKAMTALGMRSSDLSRRLPADPATVSRWRSGQRSFSREEADIARLAECFVSFARSEKQQAWLKRALDGYKDMGLDTAGKLALWFFDGKAGCDELPLPQQAAGVCFPGADGFLTALAMLEHAAEQHADAHPVTVYIASEQSQLVFDGLINRSLWGRLFALGGAPARVIVEQSRDAQRLEALLSVFAAHIQAGLIALECLPGVERYLFYSLTVHVRGVGLIMAMEPPLGRGESVSLFLEEGPFVQGTAAMLASVGQMSVPLLKLTKDAGDEYGLTKSCYSAGADLRTRFGSVNPLYASEECYRALMISSGLSYEARKYRLRRFGEMRQAFEQFLARGRYRGIVSLSAIDLLALGRADAVADLAFAENRDATALARFSASLVRGMIDFLERYKNLELMLITDEAADANVVRLKEDRFLLLQGALGGKPVTMYSDNWLVVNEYDKQLDRVWKSGRGVFGRSNVLYVLSRKLKKMEENAK